MLPRSLRHRAPLLWLVLPLVAGLAAGRLGCPANPRLLLPGALLLASLALLCAWRGSRPWAWALCLSLALSGLASHELNRRRIQAYDRLPPREAVLRLRCDRVFHSASGDKVSAIATVTGADPHLRELVGQRLHLGLALRRSMTAPLRSSEIKAVGVLSSVPFDPPNRDFSRYLADSGINFQMTRGRVLATLSPANAYYSFCEAARRRFSSILGLGLAEEHPGLVGVLRAMMLGEQHELSPEQSRLFVRSGTMHLFAISGLHIIVIAEAIELLLGLAIRQTLARSALSLVLLWLYVDITGASPSAVRAFLMAAASSLAFVGLRRMNPLASLTLSTLVVVLAAPFQVFSASFQMSYGIVAALVLYGLPMSERWLAAWQPWDLVPRLELGFWRGAAISLYRELVASLATGVASTFVGLISGITYFKLISPLSLLSNLVMIPVSSLVIYGGFVSLLLGLPGALAPCVLFNHASSLVIAVLEACARGSLALPGSSVAAEFREPWFGGFLTALMLGSCLWGYAMRWSGICRFGWPPVAITVLTLIAFTRYG